MDQVLVEIRAAVVSLPGLEHSMFVRATREGAHQACLWRQDHVASSSASSSPASTSRDPSHPTDERGAGLAWSRGRRGNARD